MPSTQIYEQALTGLYDSNLLASFKSDGPRIWSTKLSYSPS